jgi:hypothetical protein
MLTATENKLARDVLIQRLLASPLALKLQESMNFNAQAVREWATSAIETLTANRAPIIARLTEKAKQTGELRDRLKKEFEAAEIAADKAGAAARDAKEFVAERRVSLQHIATARDSWLQEKNIFTIEDAIKFVGGL